MNIEKIWQTFSKEIIKKITEEGEKNFNGAKIGWIREQPFVSESENFSEYDEPCFADIKSKLFEPSVGDLKIRNHCPIIGE